MKNNNKKDINTAFFAKPLHVMEFWKLTRRNIEISFQRYSNEFTSRFYLNRCNCNVTEKHMHLLFWAALLQHVSERRQPRTFPRHGIICPARIYLRRRTEGQAVQLSMQRLARLYIVTITSFQVFTTTRRHRTHLYLFSRLVPCIRMHVLRYATLYPHFDFASRSSIGNVETGEPLPRYKSQLGL